ncbi:glycosyltransferase family 2 protein [bacterium]|nr:glycosyltransferase family 2 protein [bacterium]
MKRNHRTMQPDYCPKVSMVVSAHNEEDIIVKKCENFKELEYPNSKINLIIGSDGSRDKTNDLLTAHACDNIQCFIFENQKGKAATLNQLLIEAEGEIVVFSDANTMYDQNAIKKLVRHFSDRKVGGVCGHLILKNPNENVGGQGEQLYWDYENIIKNLEGQIKTTIGANGAIYALRKELYKALPTNKVIMDDFLVPLSAIEQGFDFVYDSEAKAYESTSPHIEGEFQRKVRIGAANFNALPEIKRLLFPSRGFVSFALWSHKIFRWFGPFFLIAIFLSNLFLFNYLFFKLIMIAQIIFYGAAIMGYISIHLIKKLKIFTYPFYFCVTNAALLYGFIKYITKSQKPGWKRIDRA